MVTHRRIEKLSKNLFNTNTAIRSKLGAANGQTVACPPNTACSDIAQICSSTSIAIDCAPACGICSPDGRFACVNATTYAPCFGAATPNTAITSACPSGLVCDITAAAPQFCSNRTNVSFGKLYPTAG